MGNTTPTHLRLLTCHGPRGRIRGLTPCKPSFCPTKVHPMSFGGVVHKLPTLCANFEWTGCRSWGVETWLAYCGQYALIQTQIPFSCLLHLGPSGEVLSPISR